MLQKYELLCCSLAEQRPEPTPWLEGAANCTLVIVLVSMPKGHSWVDLLSALLHCLHLPPSPWKQNKMFLINSRALILLSLYGVLIKLSSITIPSWSHVFSANKSAGWKESFCLPAMESQRAPWLPICQIICVCLSLRRSAPFQVFLTCCAGGGSPWFSSLYPDVLTSKAKLILHSFVFYLWG